MKIKLGIIGFGGMGKWHADNAPRAGVEVVSICDILEERVKEGSERGLETFFSADELLASQDINTVMISVPNHLHKEMCIKAARAGKHVIVEKPAAMTVEEFDEMVQVCKEENVLFTCHQNRRWDRDMLTVKSALDSKQLGKVFTVESKLHSGNGYMHEWHIYKKYGGGMIYDWGVHLIDQILFMFPEVKVKSIYSDVKSVLHEEVDDYFKIIMKLSNGITAHIELSTYILDYQPRWLVAGDKGTLTINTFACDGQILRTGKKLDKLPPQITETEAGPTRQFAPLPPGGLIEEPLPKVETDWVDFYKNFDAVMNGLETLKIQSHEVRRVLSIMEAVRISSSENKVIYFER